MSKSLPADFVLPTVLRPEFRPCLRYYRNSASHAAEHALLLLQASVDQGYWYPGFSRKVKAALSKTHRKETELAAADTDKLTSAGKQFFFARIDVEYGRFECTLKYPEVAATRTPFGQWVAVFLPVAEAIAKLDATRPKPVIVFKTLSPTVVENLGRTLGLDLVSVEAPEIRWDLVEGVDQSGKRYSYYTPTILWSEGTVHHSSKFCVSDAGNHQCEACGHAIKNSFNWVPLFGRDKSGVAHSLWTGKDCAKKLFGCEVTGEAEFRKEGA